MWNWSLFVLQMRTSSLHKFLKSFGIDLHECEWIYFELLLVNNTVDFFLFSKQHTCNLNTSVHNSMYTCTVINMNVLRKLALFFQMTILYQSQMELSLCSQRFTANSVWGELAWVCQTLCTGQRMINTSLIFLHKKMAEIRFRRARIPNKN